MGRRILDGLDTGTRTTILAIVLTIAVAAVLLAVEVRRHGGDGLDLRRHWVLPAVVGLSVGIGALALQRLLTIVTA